MHRDENYKKLITSPRWARVRRAKVAMNPLCERCLAKGITTVAEEVHHKEPVQNGPNLYGMERLCYDMDNLESLCSDCHVEAHRELDSYSKHYKKKRAKAKTADFVSKFLKDGKGIG